MSIGELKLVFETVSKVVSLQTQPLERISTLKKIEKIAEHMNLSSFVWNIGCKNFKQEVARDRYSFLEDTELSQSFGQCHNYLEALELIGREETPGIFIIENLQPLLVLSHNADSLSREKVALFNTCLVNVCYQLKNSEDKYLVLLTTDNVELPVKLAEIIPQLENPLPSIEEISEAISEACCQGQIAQFLSSTGQLTSDIQTEVLGSFALGLTQEEVKIGLQFGLGKLGDTNLNTEILAQILLDYKTQRLKSYGLDFYDKPSVPDIGGLDLLKDAIASVRLDYSNEARKYNVPLPKGILLVGPPGNGKTLSATIIASQLNFPLVVVDVGNLIAGGAQFLRQLLRRLDAIGSCVFYFDELDKLFTISTVGEDNNTGESRAILGTLLTWLQNKKSRTYVVGSLNRLRALPPELTRKGRFDDIYYVDFPNAKERRDVIMLHCRRFDSRYRQGDPLTLGEWRQLLSATNKCSSSELASIVEVTAAKIIRRHIKESEKSTESEIKPVEINLTDLLEQRKLITPLYITDTDRIIALENESKHIAKPASSADVGEYAPDITTFWGEKL